MALPIAASHRLENRERKTGDRKSDSLLAHTAVRHRQLGPSPDSRAHAGQRWPPLTSTSWCQCSTGLRGLASISAQCSLPCGSAASGPTRHTPITSLWPMLGIGKEITGKVRGGSQPPPTAPRPASWVPLTSHSLPPRCSDPRSPRSREPHRTPGPRCTWGSACSS